MGRASITDWEGQARQYPADGPPGISYFAGETPWGTVDCLLYRNEAGELVGILNHYPFEVPGRQAPGTANVWVKPEWQRRGIGRALAREAVHRWGLTEQGQPMTAAGAAAVEKWLRLRAERLEREARAREGPRTG